jgi:hypothetical protein
MQVIAPIGASIIGFGVATWIFTAIAVAVRIYRSRTIKPVPTPKDELQLVVQDVSNAENF